MSRSIWKGNFISKALLRNSFEKKIQQDKKNKEVYKIWNRNSCIPYFLLNRTVLIHTGKEFKQVFINRGKIGFKFGEFAYTKVLKNKLQKKSKVKKKSNVTVIKKR